MVWYWNGNKPFVPSYDVPRSQWVTTLKPKQNGNHFSKDIFKSILNENFCILIRISLKIDPEGPIDWESSSDQASLASNRHQAITWTRHGGQILPYHMMYSGHDESMNSELCKWGNNQRFYGSHSCYWWIPSGPLHGENGCLVMEVWGSSHSWCISPLNENKSILILIFMAMPVPYNVIKFWTYC